MEEDQFQGSHQQCKRHLPKVPTCIITQPGEPKEKRAKVKPVAEESEDESMSTMSDVQSNLDSLSKPLEAKTQGLGFHRQILDKPVLEEAEECITEDVQQYTASNASQKKFSQHAPASPKLFPSSGASAEMSSLSSSQKYEHMEMAIQEEQGEFMEFVTLDQTGKSFLSNSHRSELREMIKQEEEDESMEEEINSPQASNSLPFSIRSPRKAPKFTRSTKPLRIYDDMPAVIELKTQSPKLFTNKMDSFDEERFLRQYAMVNNAYKARWGSLVETAGSPSKEKNMQYCA